MSWHYQIRKRIVDGQTKYGIVEHVGGEWGYTEVNISAVSKTRQGLIITLEMMLRDARRYKTIVEQ